MAVDRRTHSLDADKAARPSRRCTCVGAAGGHTCARQGPGGTSAEAIGCREAAVHRPFTARSHDRRLAPAAIIMVDRRRQPQTALRCRTGTNDIKSTSMTWMITGGAGYIGAHVVRAMAGAGERVVVLDDVSAGVPERLPAGHPAHQGLIARRRAAAAGLRRARGDGCGASRRPQAGRRIRGAAAALLPGERRRPGDAAGGGGRGRHQAVRLLLVRRGLRQPARRGPGHGGAPRASRSTPTARRSSPGSGWCGPRAGRTGSRPCACATSTSRARPRPSSRTRASSTSSRWSSTGSPAARPRGSSATTTRRRTAPACATTSTWPTSPTPTSRRPGGCRRRAPRAT